MNTINNRRFIRSLPGRLRCQVYGLQQNTNLAAFILRELTISKNIYRVQPSTDTGRVLIIYNENEITPDDLLNIIASIEEHEHYIDDQIAVTVEEIPSKSAWSLVQKNNAIPFPLLVSMGGLTLLGLKQILWGKSALARSPLPFYLSGVVSIATGYPYFKQGIAHLSNEKKINADLLLGISSFSLALVRENLVVLAGLGILQYARWKKVQSEEQQNPFLDSKHLSPQIKSYARSAERWGMITAGLTWFFSKNPLRGLGVLLAANPRPILTTAEYAWNQAALEAKENQYSLPQHSSIPQLSRTTTLLLEDVSLLFADAQEPIQYVVHEPASQKKILTVTASLLEKSSHPWKKEMLQNFHQSPYTTHKAFHKEESENGISGKIAEMNFYLGNEAFIKKQGIATLDFALDAKRLTKKNYLVQFIADEHQCFGILYKKQLPLYKEWSDLTETHHLHVEVLQNRYQLNQDAPSSQGVGFHWIGLNHQDITKKINTLHKQGEEVLLIQAVQHDSSFTNSNIPTISIDELYPTLQTFKFTKQVSTMLNHQFAFTKAWNTIGTLLAIPGVLSAPIINLVGDAISLAFLSHAKKKSEGAFSNNLSSYSLEAAVTTEQNTRIPWHAMTKEEVKSFFNVQEELGLSQEQVVYIQKEYGFNQFDIKKPVPWIQSYLEQFKEFTTLILFGTSVLSFFTGGWLDGMIMGSILLMNAAIGTTQERKAEKVVQSIKPYQSPPCLVIRNGQELHCPAKELVPGDIVHIEAGDRVPADVRVIQSWNLQVNEMTLTGESLPVEKIADSINNESVTISDQKNMLFMGTDITRGKGIGIVVHTGMMTEMGHLTSLLEMDTKEITPLQKKVTAISKKFVKWALIAGGIVFVAGLLRSVPLTQMIATSVTLAASAVPEGLPVTITIALSAGMFRMAKKSALFRKLSSLETLGRTTVICTDKTGTLTKSEMTVKTVVTPSQKFTVSGIGYQPEGEIIPEENEVAAASNMAEPIAQEQPMDTFIHHPELHQLLLIGALCNNSKLQQENDNWTVLGDPTEGALLTLAAKKGITSDTLTYWHRGLEVPFDSNSGQMSVVCRNTELIDEQEACYLFSKGSIETILRHSGWYQYHGKVLPLTEQLKQQILNQNEQLAKNALRVLGFAYRPSDWYENVDEVDHNEMIFVGLTGMIDPPKEDIEKSIQEAFDLGVKPIMITGDHPITAISIAKQLGIADEHDKVLSGHELDRLSDEQLANSTKDVSIYARVTPEHKLRIVTALQKQGHIVTMTGDGINDSPAIKQANVGIAMGQKGTQVTKEAADMILQEDHFGLIVEGVKEGRTIIHNIRKALGCLLTGNLGEVLVTTTAVIIGLPIPLVPIQILLMNLITDALPAMILAVNPGNKTKHTQKTEIADTNLYKKVMVRGGLLGFATVGLFAGSLAVGIPLPIARSMAFATLVSAQLVQTFSWRQEGAEEALPEWRKERFLMGAMGISWLALLASLYMPPIARFLNTAPLSIRHWLPIMVISGSISLLSKPILSIMEKWEPANPISIQSATANSMTI